jgi:carbon-monoxide dehydrogenase medium subunit
LDLDAGGAWCGHRRERDGKELKRYAAETFVGGAFTTKLGENEVIVSNEVPRLSERAKWAYHKINRKTGEFANAIGITILDQKTGLARILAGATEGAPIVLTKTAARLKNEGWDAACLLVADELAELVPHSDLDDRELHAVAVRRALMQLERERA